MRAWADRPVSAWVIAAFAFAFAAVSALPHAGGWNDGSRLASVESLADRGTFAIGDSPFATSDKLFIDGRFYSDKPPLPSVPLAAAYRGLVLVGFPRPAERPDVFCRVVVILLCGLSYAVAVGCMWALGRRAGLTPGWRAVWLAGFALATVLPAYTRQANTHIAQTAAVAAVALLLGRIADATARGRVAWVALVGVGTLLGVAYNLDFGVGPPLVPVVLTVVAVRTRSAAAVAVVALAVLPWVVAGHGLNYAIGREWLRPLNMNPDYLRWPGSPFDTSNMTGVLRPRSALDVSAYALELLFGIRGFLTHNLPLLLAVPAAWLLLRRPGRDRAELIGLVAWAVVGWGLYAVLSNNRGGGCVSVRWFLPFLVPGFWVLARLLAERPQFRPDFVALAAWGAVMAAVMWWGGPWRLRMVPVFWPVLGLALVTWAVVRWRAWRTARMTPPTSPDVRVLATRVEVPPAANRLPATDPAVLSRGE
jgi:4-amino-4-deoxy-L-arabinose transferase-like glycosyltransferase